MKIILVGIILIFITGMAVAGPGQMHYVKPLQAKLYEKPSGSSKVKFFQQIQMVLSINQFLTSLMVLQARNTRNPWIRHLSPLQGGLPPTNQVAC